MKKTLAVLAVLALSFTAANATTFTVGTNEGQITPGFDNQGWWSDTDVNERSNDNYVSGLIRLDSYRNYFTFDLSALSPTTVTAATLRLQRFRQSGTPTITFYDMSTSATDLARRGISDNAVFDDLGSGISYGSFTTAAGEMTDVLEFSLNAAALADISAALGGYFSIGGAAENGFIFSASFGSGATDFTQELVIETAMAPIPLPAPALLLMGGLAGLAALRRRAA